MQILRTYPRPTELETLEVGPAICVLLSLPGIVMSVQESLVQHIRKEVLERQTSERGLK